MTEASAPPRRDYRRATRRVVTTALVAGLMATTAYWAWHQPFMAYPRTLWEISRMPRPGNCRCPCRRSGRPGRRHLRRGPQRRPPPRRHRHLRHARHAGRSATRGVVLSVRESGIGGKQVWVIGPARERHYYAHLEEWAPGLERGDVLHPATARPGRRHRQRARHAAAPALRHLRRRRRAGSAAAAARGCGGGEAALSRPAGSASIQLGGRCRPPFPHEPLR